MAGRCVLPLSRPPDTLVISGGGVKGLAALGAVAHLHRAGALGAVKNVVATSSGSIVGALFVMDKMQTGLRQIIGHRYTPDIDIQRLQAGFGLDSGQTIADLLDRLIDPPDLTLGQLRAATGKNLCVVVTNVSRRRTEVLTAETHAHVTVAEAIRASCSVPLVFAARKIDGQLMCDGGVCSNFPMRQARAMFPRSCTVGICYATDQPVGRHIDSISDYLVGVFDILSSSQGCDEARDCLLVSLKTHCRALDFTMPRTKRYRLFLQGVRQTKHVIKKNQ